MTPQDEADTSCKVISFYASEIEQQQQAAHMHFKGSSSIRGHRSRRRSSRSRLLTGIRFRIAFALLWVKLTALLHAPAKPKQLRDELRSLSLALSAASSLPPTRVYNKCGNCFLFAILMTMPGQEQRVPSP